MTTFLITLSLLVAHDRGANLPYISTDDGLFYARCVPADRDGSAGTTVILEVGRETDRVVDRYDWYSRERVRLGWSPLAGKIAVASRAELPGAGRPPTQLSFHLGGKLLKSYTLEQLKPLGLGEHPVVSSNGQHQIAIDAMAYDLENTNRRYFPVRFGRGREPVRFDILTGEPMKP